MSVFIMPPSLGTLEERLVNRGTDSPESLRKRMEKARHEISLSPEFDKIIINGRLENALLETVEIVKTFLNSKL